MTDEEIEAAVAKMAAAGKRADARKAKREAAAMAPLLAEADKFIEIAKSAHFPDEALQPER